MGVPEVTEPAQWCRHCKPGGGCKIYDSRPAPCRDFECGWLANDGDPEYRPDRIHMVVGGQSDIFDAYVVYVDPTYPDAPDMPLGRKLLDAMMRAGRHPNVVLITGEKRRLIGLKPPAAGEPPAIH